MIVKIKDKLRGNEEEVRKILEELQLHNIHKSGNSFRFGFDDVGSGSGNSINIDTLGYISFSKSNKSGDIITLVSDCKDIKIGDSIKWIANKLSLDFEYTQREVKLPFGGFFKNFKKAQDISDSSPITYGYERLLPYLIGVSMRWVKEGISAITQEVFEVGYDVWTNRIVYPWRNEVGDIVGIIGRLNKDDIGEKEAKYLPIIPFNKSKILYGLYENYKNILAKGCVIVAESEKSVLLGREKGLDNVVALGGNDISERQARLLKSLCCTIIVALDEDIELEHAIKQAQKTKIENVFFSNEVYVVDMNNELITESKVSLLDLDIESIKKIMNEHLIYIG